MNTDPRLVHSSDDINVLKLARLLYRNGRMITGASLLFGIATAIAVILGPRVWESGASFVPVGSNRTASLSGIAAQFGLQLPSAGADAAVGSNFYADLVTSDEILRAVSSAKYRTSKLHGDSVVSLEDWYRVEDPDPMVRQEYVVRQLKAAVEVAVSIKTGLVEMKVRAADPLLAQEICRSIVTAADSFDIKRRSVAAADERRFQDERLSSARSQLAIAENALQDFLLRNSSYATPALAMAYEKLLREVTARQSLVSTLQLASEQSRIEEARNTRRIALITTPHLPALPIRRRLLLKTLAGLLGGGVLGALWVTLADSIRRQWQVARISEDLGNGQDRARPSE